MDIQDMRADLEEYYECAGFAGVYDKILKYKSDDQIHEIYRETFLDRVDFVLENWEESFA